MLRVQRRYDGLPSRASSTLRELTETVNDGLFVRVFVSSLAGAGHDDTSAINDAIDAALLQHAAGNQVVVEFGPKCYSYAQAHSTLRAPVGLVGQGTRNTIVAAAPTLSGDVFSWSDVWLTSPPFARGPAGVLVAGFTLVGNRNAPTQQNGFMFYDRADWLLIDDVTCLNLPGAALTFGYAKNSSQAYLRESTINRFRVYSCGLPSVPSVEFSSAGVGDSTNTNKVVALDIFDHRGPGLVIRNQNNVKGVGFLDFFGLRIEGSVGGHGGDSLVIGDAVYAGGVNQLNFFGTHLINGYAGQNALSTIAPTNAAGNNIYGLNFSGLTIGPGPGNGLNIQAGRLLTFDVVNNSVTGTKLAIGPANGGVNYPIRIDGRGYEVGWSKDVHSTSAERVSFAPRNNYTAAAPPGVTDDQTKLYGAGSMWISGGVVWCCTDPATGAAVWARLS